MTRYSKWLPFDSRRVFHSLDFGTTADAYYVDHGTLGNDGLASGTVLAKIWIPKNMYFDGNRLADKHLSTTSSWGFSIGAASVAPWDFAIYQARDSLPNRLQALSGDRPIRGGMVEYVAAVWDISGVNGDQKLFYGNENKLLTEVSAYTTQQVGSGGSAPTTANFQSGARAGQSWSYLGGRILTMAVWAGTILDLDELRLQQRVDFPVTSTAPTMFTRYGETGGTQVDLSGNGYNGTVTGATPAPVIEEQRRYWSVPVIATGETKKVLPVLPQSKQLSALNFGPNESTPYVNHGSDSSIDDVGERTVLMLTRFKTWPSGGVVYARKEGTVNDGLLIYPRWWVAQTTWNGIGMSTSSTANIAEIAIAALQVGVWQWFGFWGNPAASSNYAAAYMGYLNVPLAQYSPYYTNRSSHTSTDAGNNLTVGGDSGVDSIDADIACFFMWGGRVPLSSLIKQQFNPLTPVYRDGLLVFSHYNNAGDVLDLSGYGNHGIVSGASLSAGPRIQLPNRYWSIPRTRAGSKKVVSW